MKLLSIYSKNNNIYNHSALEEYLLNYNTNFIFFLWVNSRSVVIGRNQNPWIEINMNKAKKDKIMISRRLTGGGAVFHDLGNINYTFIVPKKISHIESQMKLIQDVLLKFNISTKIGSKNDILYKGFKFSGNSFVYKKNRMIHHGTLLINTDLDFLYSILQSKYLKYIDQSKAVNSNRSEVINLKQVCKKNISFPLLFEGIQNKLVKYLSIKETRVVSFQKIKHTKIFEQYVKKYTSDEWIFENTPQFILKVILKSLNQKTIFFNIKKGKINDIFSDSEIDSNLLDQMRDVLIGISFRSKKIKQALQLVDIKGKNDLLNFFDVNFF